MNDQNNTPEDLKEKHKTIIAEQAKVVAEKRFMAQEAIVNALELREKLDASQVAKEYNAAQAISSEYAQIVAEAEQDLRLALLMAFQQTGDKTYDVGTVSENTKRDVDEEAVIAWALEHGIFSLLNISLKKAAFNKVKDLEELQGMYEERIELGTKIASDLSHLLPQEEQTEPEAE